MNYFYAAIGVFGISLWFLLALFYTVPFLFIAFIGLIVVLLPRFLIRNFPGAVFSVLYF